MEPIKIDITILRPVEKVWEYFIGPEHITKWNFANKNWHCTKAENDFRPGGRLRTRMEVKDGSYGFDYIGIYQEIIPYELIRYQLEDGRNVEVRFESIDNSTTKVIQIFDPEAKNSREMQREGWYAILNNFHKYAENH